MLYYIIIVNFDLNNVSKICHFKSIKESFMSFSNAKNTPYTIIGYSIFIRFVSNFFNCFYNILKTFLYMFIEHFKY
jgi:hypothetical protein